MAKRKSPEKAIENAILSFLWAEKIYCWKNETQGTFDPIRKTFRKHPNKKKGVSDILGILPDGRFLAIEVKSKVGRLSPDQKAFIEDIVARDGIAFVARSIEDVQRHMAYYLQDNACPIIEL